MEEDWTVCSSQSTSKRWTAGEQRRIFSITFTTDKNRLTKIVSLQDLMSRKQVLMRFS